MATQKRLYNCIKGVTESGVGANGLSPVQESPSQEEEESNHQLPITMKKAFRKYHRILGIIVCLPLLLTVVTGMLATIAGEWPINLGLSSNLMLKIHTGEIFHLQAIYPILNGFGLIGLLVTGMSMSGLFNQKKRPNINN